jgi:hypothetical protein
MTRKGRVKPPRKVRKPKPAPAWNVFRHLWESKPEETYASIARSAGVTDQAVAQRAKREGWEKAGNAAGIARRAQVKADEIRQCDEALRLGVEADAVNIRSEILAGHRKEWEAPRAIIYEALKTKDFEKAKLGKITAEGLKIVQDGERKAWALDALDAPPDTAEIMDSRL